MRGPDFSPDGRQLMFSSNATRIYEVHVVSREGGKWGAPRQLTRGADLPRTGGSQRWSPDSRLVYFVPHDARGLAGVWSMPLTGGPLRRRVRFEDPATDFGRGRFAMHGNRIYFPLEKRESDIWTAEVLAR